MKVFCLGVWRVDGFFSTCFSHRWEKNAVIYLRSFYLTYCIFHEKKSSFLLKLSHGMGTKLCLCKVTELQVFMNLRTLYVGYCGQLYVILNCIKQNEENH